MKSTTISVALAVTLIINVWAGPMRDTAHALHKRDTFQWGSIGDSYASGVAYLQSNTYDNNAGGCLRTTEAYANQLKNDVSWMNGWQELFTWAACSGSRLVNMQDQIQNVGDSPRLVTMHAGGNDAMFFGIADSCIFHSQGKDYGLTYESDPDRTGECAKAIDAATSYVANSLGKDLNNTIDSILAADNVKSQPDFLLYVLGYAQFFNGDTTWCNDHSFGIRSRAPLSQYLRNDMNRLTTNFNSAYSSWIAAYPTKNIRFVSIDEAFGGHRFCDAGFSSIWGQYFDSEIWFWNVLPPNFAVSQDASDSDIETAIQSAGGDVTLFGSGTGSVSDGWKLRPFHPKQDGHTGIEGAIKDQMKKDGIPPAPSAVATSATPASATPPPASSTPPAYAPGTCSFHLDEWEDCSDDSSNLFAQITMYDNNKAVIGQTDVDPDTLGAKINTDDPYSFVSKLSQPMVVVGEHENDYVQFTIGTLAWKSTDKTGPASCTVGGWDPRDGPICGQRFGNKNAKNQMDCSFPC